MPSAHHGTFADPDISDAELVDLDGDRWLRIADYDQLPAFFMTVASATDVWLFLSSTGGLTAGRNNADHALFPYYTDDKITESAGRTGGVTLVRASSPEGREHTWQPFGDREPGRRTLYKSSFGDAVMFEHRHHELELTFRVTLAHQPALRTGAPLLSGIHRRRRTPGPRS